MLLDEAYFLPPSAFLTCCLMLFLPSQESFHADSNENNNNGKNSITSISLSVITLFHQFPFLLKLYLTSSAVVHKQDYWYLSEMKVHFLTQFNNESGKYSPLQ